MMGMINKGVKQAAKVIALTEHHYQVLVVSERPVLAEDCLLA